MFSSHSLIQNGLINNDDALVNAITQYFNQKFAKGKKISQDSLLKLVEEKKASRDFNAEKLYHGVTAVTKMANNIALIKVNIWLLYF